MPSFSDKRAVCLWKTDIKNIFEQKTDFADWRRTFKEEKKYHLRIQRLNSDGNFYEHYDYNIL